MASSKVLPPELWEEIFEQFCLHCTPLEEEKEDEDHYPEETRRIISLWALCLTSRTLNSIATRHLYHRPDCRKWWLLARTLASHPDLGRHVKDLRAQAWETLTEDPLVVDHPHPEAHMKRFLLQQVESISPKDRDDLLQASHDASVDIMCRLCPNIERFHVSDLYFKCDENGVGFRGTPGSLLSLKHLDNVSDFSYQFIIDHGHDLQVFATLFHAAPNIERLYLYHTYHCDHIPLALGNLTYLELAWCGMGTESLANLLRCCPRLETLKYLSSGFSSGYDSDAPVPTEVSAVVLEHSPNLKSFHLDMSSTNWEWWQGEETDDELDLAAEFAEAKEDLESHGIKFIFHSDYLSQPALDEDPFTIEV